MGAVRSDTVSRVGVRSEHDLTSVTLSVGQSAEKLGFSVVEVAHLRTVGSELATNIVKYAGRGELSVARCEHGARVGLEITATDRGPGIADLDKALEDSFTTGDSLGLGLPGVRRMADDFEIRSEPGVGTTVVVRKWRR
jgi:serine/threonine-protein kinase RsbT